MISRAKLIVFVISAAGMVLALAIVLKTWPRATGAPAHAAALVLSFKVDPRVADPTHAGTRWLSQDYYGANAQDTVEAQAQGLDAKGKPFAIRSDWIASDPDMVTVSPTRGDHVRIVVKRAGESKLKIVAGDISTERMIQAKYLGKFIQIAITRPRPPEPVRSISAAVASTPFPGVAEAAERKARALAEFNSKEGKLTLPNGLEYKILHAGNGRIPNPDDRVKAHYRITSMDGTELANSYASGNPATISVARATSGLKEALQVMPVGSKWQLFLPRQPGSGGGHRRRPGRAIPGRVLEVELLAIEGPAGAAQRMAADSASPDDKAN